MRTVPNRLERGEDVYEWFRTVLLPCLFIHDGYGGRTAPLGDQVYTGYGSDYRVTPLQIRQLRMSEREYHPSPPTLALKPEIQTRGISGPEKDLYLPKINK